MISKSKANKKELLNNIINALQLLLREHKKWLLLIGTGPSMGVNKNMGMGALRDHLLKDANLNKCPGWSKIADHLRTKSDLEQALTNVGSNQELRIAITQSAGNFVAEQDACFRDKILTGNIKWPCTILLKKLVQKLPRNYPRLPVITSNYDLFIEYACSYAEIPYTTGYIGGMIKRSDWNSARNALFRIETKPEKRKLRNIRVPIPCIEIMKVHGSINLFESPNRNIIECDSWCTCPPAGYQRVLACPGDLKHYAVTEHHEAWFAEADRAFRAASAFMAIGYGFNDKHIHKILEEKAKALAPIIVLTKDASNKLDDLIDIGENIWILTGAMESDGKTIENKTRIKNITLTEDLEIENECLWRTNEFVNKVMGE